MLAVRHPFVPMNASHPHRLFRWITSDTQIPASFALAYVVSHLLVDKAQDSN